MGKFIRIDKIINEKSHNVSLKALLSNYDVKTFSLSNMFGVNRSINAIHLNAMHLVSFQRRNRRSVSNQHIQSSLLKMWIVMLKACQLKYDLKYCYVRFICDVQSTFYNKMVRINAWQLISVETILFLSNSHGWSTRKQHDCPSG